MPPEVQNKTLAHEKNLEKFAQECLEAHNKYRLKHGVPPLILSKKLCQASKKWADKIGAKGTLEPSKSRKYGENLYCSWTTGADYQPKGNEPVDSWYEEQKDYHYGIDPMDLRSSYFTQMIWKNTTELGVAYSRDKNGSVYVIANYYPPGNVFGHFKENVLPPGGGSIQTTSKSSTKSSALSTEDEREVVGHFENECLNAHNEYRKMHGVKPLILTHALCKYSEEWANELANKGKIENRHSFEYGENVYCSRSAKNINMNGKEPVDQWYKEVINYVFGREPKFIQQIGHFTQVIWKNSRELGVAVAKSDCNQLTFVVANYFPPGNFMGQFHGNVLPPVFGKIFESLKSSMTSISISEFSITSTYARTIKDYNTTEFSKEAVRIHNQYRKIHNVPALKYSEKLTKLAQQWVDKLAADDRLYHRPESEYGESIFYSWTPDENAIITPGDVCKFWYDEIKVYTFTSEPSESNSEHFTQMIWKNSKEMGMAMARGLNGKVFIVAYYYPRGNVVGEIMANVPN